MIFVVEPPIGALNTALNDALAGMGSTSKLVLGAVLAGMMAIDMGGPFNKAAYVFGTASIIEGNYAVMAAVMIGGMVPPCAIALATLLFKNKFTKAERESGRPNFIMGSCFYYGRCDTFCGVRPVARDSLLYHRLGCCRCAVHGIWLYFNGAARRNLCLSGSRTCAYVSGGIGSRYRYQCAAFGCIKEKGEVKA